MNIKIVFGFVFLSFTNAVNELMITPPHHFYTEDETYESYTSKTSRKRSYNEAFSNEQNSEEHTFLEDSSDSMNSFESDMPPRTPSKQMFNHMPNDEVQTPGKIALTEQVQLFSDKNHFVQCIGAENMQTMLNELDDSKEKQDAIWNMLSDPLVEYDNIEKCKYLDIISDYLLNLGDNEPQYKTNDFHKLLSDVYSTERAPYDVSCERCEQHVRNYLINMGYKDDNIQIRIKTNGIQLGYIIDIKKDTANTVTYYAKTHSQGTLENYTKYRPAKEVNYEELFIYKLLENLKLGPKSYFFGREEKNFYIMTLDASIDPNNMQSLGKFSTFEELKNNEKDLREIFKYKYKHNQDNDYEKLICAIENDEKSKKLLYNLAMLHCIMFITQITDLQCNSDNFGFNINNGKLEKLKIIDMRVPKNIYCSKSIQSFTDGTLAPFQRHAEDALMYAFKTRDLKLRLKDAQKVMNNEFEDFENALKEAYNKMLPIINQHYTDTEKAKSMIENLEERCKGILKNYKTLKDGIPVALDALNKSPA